VHLGVPIEKINVFLGVLKFKMGDCCHV